MAGAGRHVLVVEDNLIVAKSLAFLLETEGHEVQTVRDGETALKTARSFGPHAVVLDIGLPGIDGHEVAKRMRAEPTTRTALLIALTGYGRQEDQNGPEAAGFDHYLIKPSDPDTLLELIRTAPTAA
jgi:CheY-like chemotaxis protein